MKNIKIELKWAILFAVMMLLWMLMEKLAGFHDEKIASHALVSYFVAIPAIAMYVFALLDKRKNFYMGVMTYAQGFKAGLIMTIFVTVLSPLTQYITSTIITPDYFKNIISYVVENKLMTLAAAESYFNLKSYLMTTVISTPIMGILTTAIVAIFIRKKA